RDRGRVGTPGPQDAEQVPHGPQDGAFEIGRGGQVLVRPNPTGGVDGGDVREGTAHVSAEPDGCAEVRHGAWPPENTGRLPADVGPARGSRVPVGNLLDRSRRYKVFGRVSRSKDRRLESAGSKPY